MERISAARDRSPATSDLRRGFLAVAFGLACLLTSQRIVEAHGRVVCYTGPSPELRAAILEAERRERLRPWMARHPDFVLLAALQPLGLLVPVTWMAGEVRRALRGRNRVSPR